MKVVQKLILVIVATGVCSIVSAQSMRWAESGVEYCRKLSDSTYVSVNSDGSLGMASFKIVNNQFWMVTGENSEYKGYCSYSNDEYIYYDRNDNIVAGYIPSQGRYYMHSSQGHTILKSESYAVLNQGILRENANDEIIIRYTVDVDFDPVAVGFILLVY